MTVEADGRRLRDVGEPRHFVTSHASPQPALPPLGETEWDPAPARRLAPYRPHRPCAADARRATLFSDERAHPWAEVLLLRDRPRPTGGQPIIREVPSMNRCCYAPPIL